mmetsp:Transcript_17976/g.44101  ORF Transcript_17976/g.44101 Transcript_17976/m.44101 type:complete len:207 (-) Transcript_17976:940-1560(-)
MSHPPSGFRATHLAQVVPVVLLAYLAAQAGWGPMPGQGGSSSSAGVVRDLFREPPLDEHLKQLQAKVSFRAVRDPGIATSAPKDASIYIDSTRKDQLDRVAFHLGFRGSGRQQTSTKSMIRALADGDFFNHVGVSPFLDRASRFLSPSAGPRGRGEPTRTKGLSRKAEILQDMAQQIDAITLRAHQEIMQLPPKHRHVQGPAAVVQ